MANRNFSNGGKIRIMHIEPVLVDCNFIVDSTNGNGLGVRSLKGPLVQNVYMHTSATPATGNPNPASGTILIQLADTYNRSLSGFNSNVSPVSGSALKIDNAALTAGVPYIITTVGNSTLATWQAIGLPSGVTPAIGVPFIATGTGGTANVSTSRVETTASGGSTIMSIETVGDPNTSITALNTGYGAYFICQCRNISGAVAAPADGTTISLAFYLKNSSVPS